MFNGAINLAKRLRDVAEKVFIWKVPDPEAGPGMYRYSERGPGITSEERRQIEPWNYPQRDNGIERERERQR
jgi:hypothetical protein